ncbi:hypothetical protein [Micromonospora chersina]|uniref:hypothetical protein n=1 Tax=Micromonospora chersina TaxID=47854 RepID=UPI00371FA239
MLELSDDLLQLEPGQIVYLSPLRSGPTAGTWAITVPLAPLSATDRFDPATFRPGTDGPEIVRTAIRGEFIDLPGNDLSALTSRTFDFPINPHASYIDASIYLGGGHNPVDITRMEFGAAHSLNIDVVLHAAFDFSQEGVEIANRSAVLHANLQFEQFD